jgi:nucleotide-binding universal stress UspA family protein
MAFVISTGGTSAGSRGGAREGLSIARRFLVGHDGSPESTRALAEAVRLARARHGCLTVVLAPSRAPRCAVLGPVSVVTLEREVRQAAEAELAGAVRAIDRRVSVTTVQTSRPLGRALVDLWRRGEHDLVVVAAPCFLGSRRVALWRLRRAGVEPLVVHPPAAAPARSRRAARTRRARPA